MYIVHPSNNGSLSTRLSLFLSLKVLNEFFRLNQIISYM